MSLQYNFAYSKIPVIVIYCPYCTDKSVSGENISQKELGYVPPWRQAVACSAQHIFVGNGLPPMIYIYNWQGKEMSNLTHAQLRLEGNDRVKGLSCAQNGAVLILATGNSFRVSSLHAYKVSVFS